MGCRPTSAEHHLEHCLDCNHITLPRFHVGRSKIDTSKPPQSAFSQPSIKATPTIQGRFSFLVLSCKALPHIYDDIFISTTLILLPYCFFVAKNFGCYNIVGLLATSYNLFSQKKKNYRAIFASKFVGILRRHSATYLTCTVCVTSAITTSSQTIHHYYQSGHDTYRHSILGNSWFWWVTLSTPTF